MTRMTVDQLKELLEYDPLTGVFLWRVRRSRTEAGSRAGTVTRVGYRYIAVDRRKYLAHRLAWLYCHGVWPPEQIDHKNCLKDDNRLDNLRLATVSQNVMNRGPHRDSGCGLKGVHQHRPGQFHASIASGRKSVYLGAYATPEEAHAAYVRAAAELHGEFARAA